ncbi:MAG: rod shape-determining protein RodA [Ignavibacteriaceae bacterium]
MQLDYHLKDRFDFGLILPVIVLFSIGLAAIYSATYNNAFAQGNFQRQLIWGFAALVLFFITYSLPIKSFKQLAFPTYLFSIILLIAVILIGKKVSGARSWIAIGTVGFQPSEFAKIGTILLLSKFLSRNNTDIESFKDLLFTLAIGFLPVLLIFLEPDMGTAVVFLLLIITLIFWKGISVFAMFVVLSPAFVAISSLFGTYYFITALSLEHQQQRIQAFIDPMSDPLGSGYNTIQAKVAIGSGGLFGKGFLAGNQTQLQFIPEQWTDFVYCVIGEEFGFIGTILMLGLFTYLFIRILKISSVKDEFLSLVSVGILSIYFTHFIINIGMVVGIMPVIGLPLPFVSYGGSSLLVNMVMLGILANIYKSRKYYS